MVGDHVKRPVAFFERHAHCRMIQDHYEFNEIVKVRPNGLIFPQHADIFNVYFLSLLGRYTFVKKNVGFAPVKR